MGMQETAGACQSARNGAAAAATFTKCAAPTLLACLPAISAAGSTLESVAAGPIAT